MYQNETVRYLMLTVLLFAAPYASAEAVEEPTEAAATCDADGLRKDACFDQFVNTPLSEEPCDVRKHTANAAVLFDRNGKGVPTIGDSETVSERNEPGEG
jgi:hypothetical protein